MCVIEGCNAAKIFARGMCGRHYQWARRHGFPKELPYLEPKKVVNEARRIPEWEPGLVTHSPAGTILIHGGSGTNYVAYGCRCRLCVEANRARSERGRKDRMERTAKGSIPDTVAHGKAATYSNWGCRCDECCADWKRKCDSYYAKVLSAEARHRAELEAYESGLRKGPKPARLRQTKGSK